jgi:hypothetical protein
MAAVGMLFSAAGELLYDRTRLEKAGSWQITTAIFTMMFALYPASLFGLVLPSLPVTPRRRENGVGCPPTSTFFLGYEPVG